MINASLGAHYSSSFVWLSVQQLCKAFFQPASENDSLVLEQKLNSFLGGKKTQLVYKGRDAIELALKSYGFIHSSDCIATQAFSCSALEEAITRAGATPLYVDIGKNALNLTVETLETAWGKNKNIRAVIVQHSLGHPADIQNISHWCKEKKILLIEDLAQSFGATDEHGKKLGTYADCVILSFGRDKVIDAITGGAVVFKEITHISGFHLSFPPQKNILRDLSYPFFTFCIRLLFPLGLGKILHGFLKKIGWLTSPTFSPTEEATLLPHFFTPLIVFQLEQWEEHFHHRKKIASFYLQAFENTSIPSLTQRCHLDSSSLLRFVIRVPDVAKLLQNWKKENIHLSDRWYRHPIDGGISFRSHWYEKGSCPNAEMLSEHVINLPTHSKISLKDAEKIVRSIVA